jgi:DnaJ-class molecular chaperone
MSTFEQITEARCLLELPESATRETIRAHYRRLLEKWHPDKGAADQETCHDMTVRIVAAYTLIMEYCDSYAYSFSEEAVRRHLSPEEWWADRFGQDPLWGKG